MPSSERPGPRRGAVASEHALASAAGKRVLQAGGNATDAAIATALAVGTLNPYHSCIGGGGFAIIHNGHGVDTIDFRVMAPAASTPDFYRTASTDHGGAAVGVPGEIAGFAALHSKYGKLPWAELFTGAIELAEGMPMGRDLYDYLLLQLPTPPFIAGSWLSDDPEFERTFFSNGKLIPVGETWSRPDYAKTLRTLASDPTAFYTGKMPEAIVRAVTERGGLMTLEDLASYKYIWRKPIRGTYRGHTVYAPPAPASGAILLSALATLDKLPGDTKPDSTSSAVLQAHNVAEALRLAYGQRVLLGDPAFVPGVDEIQANILRGYADRVGDVTREVDYYLAKPASPPSDHGTSHITAADSDGVCSITTTIGQIFASRIMVPGYGIMLNDSMDDFSIAGKSNHFGYAPSVANYVAGGKRPLSSQCPYIVEKDGTVAFAGGSAGGATIISTNVQVIRNLLSGLSATAALAAPRLHDMVLPNVTQLERASHRGASVVGWSEEVAHGLEERGHQVQWVDKSMSTPSCVRLGAGQWEAAGDPRKYDAGAEVFDI